MVKLLLFFSMFLSIQILADNNLGGCQIVVEENDNYTHCLNTLAQYPEPVHIFIPKKLDKSKPIGMNIHFHGHNLQGYSHFDKKYADYGEFLSKAKTNSILVIPESRGNCETYDKFFKSPKDSFDFINNSKTLFTPLKMNSLTFSGHSGAYRVLNSIFGHHGLEENINIPVNGVALIDATYGSVSNIEEFAIKKLKKGKSFLFFDTYVSGKKATAEKLSLLLKDKIKKMSLAPDALIIEANQDCINMINQNQIDVKIAELSSPAFKLLIESRFKFVPLPSSSYPEKTPVLDLHFGILKTHGLTEYFEELKRI